MDPMLTDPTIQSPPDSFDGDIDRVADEFEAAWRRGLRPAIPLYLAMAPLSARAELLNELVEVDWEYRQKSGGTPDPDSYPRELSDLLGPNKAYSSQWPALRARLVERITSRTSEQQTTVKSQTHPATEAAAFPQIDGYQILGILGHGGMGDVFKALQLGTRREVALKLMRGSSISERARARFDREVELTARLDHPNIARVFDSGLHHGVYFYAMELIDGLPLDKYINLRALDRRPVLELLAEVCRAVAHAHQRGVIHRDLKPSNIMVSADGRPHLMDFGLAKALVDEDSAPRQEVSIEGELAGTPAFMSPEQAAGHVGLLDTRTDVYSLGVILYRQLCGRLPHDTSGGVLKVMRRICDEEPLRPRACVKDIGSELESLMLKALSKNPDDRYATASELARDIENYLQGEPLTVRAPSTLYFLRKRLWKHRAPVAVAAAIVLVLISMAVISYVKVSHAKNVAVTAEGIAKRETAAKEKARHLSELERADVLVSKADILGASGHWEDAKTAYATAADIFTAEGEAPIRARIGTWNANRAAPAPLNVFAGPNNSGGAVATALAISSDRRRAVTGARDGSIRLWDTAIGRLIQTNRPGNGSIWSVGFSSDGQHVISGGADGNAVVMEASTGLVEYTLAGPGGWITHVSISPDGHHALTASGETESTLVSERNDTLCLWELVDPVSPRRNKRQFNAVGRVSGAVFSPEGANVLTFGQEMALWDVAQGSKVRVFNGRERVISAAFSSDGRSIVTGGADGTIQLWDRDSASERKSIAARGGAIVSVGYAAGPEPLIVFAADDRTVRVVSATMGEDVRTYIGRGRASGDSISVPAAALSADGRFALGSAADGTLTLWGLGQTPEENIFAADGPVTDIAPFPGGEILLAREPAGPVIWDLATHRKLHPSGWTPGACDASTVSPDGRRIATVRGGTLKIWDVSKLEEPRSVAIKRKSNQPAPIAFSSDGRLLLLPVTDNAVAVIDADAGKELAQLHGHQDIVTSIAISPDGRTALTGSRDKTARLWDIANPRSPQNLSVLQSHADAVNAVAFSPDGRWAATAGGNSDYEAGQDDFAIRLWNVNSPAAPIRFLVGHTRRVRAIAFNPDGLLLASAGDDGQIKLWDTLNGDGLHTLSGGAGPVLSLTFVPGTARLLAGGEDHFIRQWDLDAPMERVSLSSALDAALRKIPKSSASTEPSALNDADLFASCGRWYAWAGIDDWAIEFFDRAGESSSVKDKLMLARCCWSLGRLDKAEAVFRSAGNSGQAAAATDWHLPWYLETISTEKTSKSASHRD